MKNHRHSFALSLFATLLFSMGLHSQETAPVSGDITVKMIQGFDSQSSRPGAASQAVVMKSTNPAVPKNSGATVQLVVDPTGGLGVQLVQLVVAGHTFRTASSAAVLAPDAVGFLRNHTRVAGAPKDSVSSPRVYLPTETLVRFTLMEPPPVPVAAPPRPRIHPDPVPPPPPPTGKAGDFPAGPGLPVLHTDRVPYDGCQWTPLVSKRFGFAILVMDCTDTQSYPKYSADDPGFINSAAEDKRLAAADGKSHLATIEVYTKLAAQTLDAAVRQQILSTIKPKWRSSCHVQIAENQKQGPGMQTYTFTATVAPGLQVEKKADLGDDLPCSPWEDTDSANSFYYKPSESKTTFFFSNTGQEEPNYDMNSIRFLSAGAAASGGTATQTTETAPASGGSSLQWTEKAGKASDVGPNVITPGTLTFGGKTTPMFFYVACSNEPNYGTTPELRAVVPALPGLPASGKDISVKRALMGIPKSRPDDQITFNNVVHAGPYVVFYIQTTNEPFDMLAAKASPQETLVYTWKGQGSEGVLQLPLPPPNASFNALLDRCNFVREGNGKISEAFAKQLVPVLHEISLLKPRTTYSPGLQTEIESLIKAARNTTEQGEAVFLNDELRGFIAQTPQTIKWKRCVQDMAAEAANGESKFSKTCREISDSMGVQ